MNSEQRAPGWPACAYLHTVHGRCPWCFPPAVLVVPGELGGEVGSDG